MGYFILKENRKAACSNFFVESLNLAVVKLSKKLH